MVDRIFPARHRIDSDNRHGPDGRDEATARVEIDARDDSIHFGPWTRRTYVCRTFEDYHLTQSKILTSETLADADSKSMGLDRLPTIWWRARENGETHTAGQRCRPDAAPLGAFLGSLSVKRVPTSRLLDVTFESTEPALAARVVNAHLNNFIEQNFRSRYEAATQASIGWPGN